MELRDVIGCACANAVQDDCLAIIITTYYGEHILRPDDDDENDENHHWGDWVMERYNRLMDVVVHDVEAHYASRITELESQLAAANRRAEEAEKKAQDRGNMLSNVIDELNLSEYAIAEHGPLGTEVSKLVRLVLDEKDREIRNLKHGMRGLRDISKDAHAHIRAGIDKDARAERDTQ